MTEVPGSVYVQTNEPNNQVVAHRRAPDGTLSRLGSVATGGKGDAKPHLTSQGSVVLSQDGASLLVTNIASDDVSVFAIGEDGPRLAATVPSGPAPKSVTEHEGLVYVLHSGDSTVTGFRLADSGLTPIEGSTRSLSKADADPAQIGFTADGSAVVVTERATDSIVLYEVAVDGTLGEPSVVSSSGPTPYGFAITSDGTLVVSEAFRAQKGDAAASSYRIAGGAITPVTSSVGNGRSEICWVVLSKDERYAFATNFADGAISRYAVNLDGSLQLDDATGGITVEGRPGLRDEDLTSDGRYLYAIDADAGSIFGWSVADGGTLSPIGSWGGLPATVAGLAAS